MFLDWGSITSFYGQLLHGAWLTLVITFSAFALAIAVGVVVAAGKMSAIAPLRWLASIYVEVLRNTPVLLQIFIVFYGLPSLGLRLSAVTAGILGLGLNVGAYLGEIFRAGVVAVPKGHREASSALAMSPMPPQVWVVAPVARRAISPSTSGPSALARMSRKRAAIETDWIVAERLAALPPSSAGVTDPAPDRSPSGSKGGWGGEGWSSCESRWNGRRAPPPLEAISAMD